MNFKVGQRVRVLVDYISTTTGTTIKKGEIGVVATVEKFSDKRLYVKDNRLITIEIIYGVEFNNSSYRLFLEEDLKSLEEERLGKLERLLK